MSLNLKKKLFQKFINPSDKLGMLRQPPPSMEGQEDHFEKEDGTVTETESQQHEDTTTKVSMEKTIIEEILDTLVLSEDDIRGDEQPNGNDNGTSDEEDPQMPTAMELDEASLRRKKGVLITDLEDRNVAGEPVIDVTDDENRSLGPDLCYLMY